MSPLSGRPPAALRRPRSASGPRHATRRPPGYPSTRQRERPNCRSSRRPRRSTPPPLGDHESREPPEPTTSGHQKTPWSYLSSDITTVTITARTAAGIISNHGPIGASGTLGSHRPPLSPICTGSRPPPKQAPLALNGSPGPTRLGSGAPADEVAGSTQVLQDAPRLTALASLVVARFIVAKQGTQSIRRSQCLAGRILGSPRPAGGRASQRGPTTLERRGRDWWGRWTAVKLSASRARRTVRLGAGDEARLNCRAG